MKQIQIPQSKDQDKSKPFERKVVPQISFNKSKLVGLDGKLQQIKICNYQADFKDQIDQVLQLYSDDELKYSDQLVLYVMQEVEKFILKPKSGESKKQLVIECCKKYFNDDPQLVEMVINLVFKKLSQIKLIKRQGYKLLRFFSKISSRISPKEKPPNSS